MATGWESPVKSGQKHVTGRPVAQLTQRAFPCCGHPGFETHRWSFAQCHLPSQSSHSLPSLKLSCQYSHEKGRGKKASKDYVTCPNYGLNMFSPHRLHVSYSGTDFFYFFTFTVNPVHYSMISSIMCLHRSPSAAAPNQLKLSRISTVRSRQCKYTNGWCVCAATKPPIGFLGEGGDMCHTAAISSVIDFSNQNASGGLSPLL